jgi:hypothetical protein
VIVDHALYIAEDFSVATVRFLGHAVDASAIGIEHARGLRVEHERHCQEALDPF